MTTIAPTTAHFNTLVSDLYGTDLPPTPDRALFRDTVAQVAERARLAMDPALAGRIALAQKLVLAGDVRLLPSGKAEVASQQDGRTVYHVVNGICECRDFAQAHGGWCKHRLAKAILVRTEEVLALAAPVLAQVEAAHVPAQVIEAEYTPTPTPRGWDGEMEPWEPALGAALPSAPASLPKECIVELHGKKFITYAGLLALAHDRGLVELEADLTTVTDTLAIARATAVFASGKRFTECADATPGNVGAKIKQHFIRMALTRAKSRALRDALNISMVALEELGE